MALKKRVWRTFAENKGRYIGIFILIFLGSFAYMTTKGFSDNYEFLVSDFAKRNYQEDLFFSTDRPIENIEALESATGALIDPYLYCDLPLSGGRELRVLSPGKKVNIPVVKTGSGLSSPQDILIDPFFASSQGLNIGDSIEAGDEIFRVVGIMAVPHYIYPLKYVNDVLPPSGFGVSVVSPEVFSRYNEAETIYSVYFHDRQQINAQAAGLRNVLEEDGYSFSDWMISSDNKRIRMPWATISGAKAMSVPLPSAMFLLCCVIIGVMIWRMIRADGVIIGMFYAQGYRKKEMLRHYMALPLIVSALGGTAGVVAGLPLIRPLVIYMASSYYNVPFDGISIAFADIAIGILMPVLFVGLACYFVINKELRKSAAELMKGDTQKSKVNFLERHVRLEKLSFNKRFQIREQLRSIPRLMFLLLGITAASMMMLFGFTINHSMTTVFNSSADGGFLYNWEYTFKQIRQDDIPEEAVPFNALRAYPLSNESAEFYLTGIPLDADGIVLQDSKGNDLPKDQVNMTYLMAERLGIKPGDVFSFIDKLNGSSYTLVIDNIIQTYSGQFIYMPLSEFNEMTGQKENSYSGVFSNNVIDYSDKELAGVKDLANLPDAMGDIAMPMTMVVVFMALMAGLMSAIIIYLVTALMIDESRQTISLLKVFGYKSKEVASLILNSSTWVVVIGFILGIPLMLLAAGSMYSYLGEMINMVLPMILNPVYVIISFVIIYGVYAITKSACRKKLASIPMSEALKAGSE